ncbi:SAC3/GNAP family-related protein, putative [Plasmodium knowlesi strain H]|uniref:SAC3/GNAP family-related protein, putative n=3 Tax=Plasmodium knowlesi TaxID=5850 RepID=A0A5K1VM56_PLAKH|nr:SAC3 domain-containing protein, putative [Plasmodium knowlesi strain H]OTN64507.1 putative SAC3/GNAP family-related protein [Plasmodium knowlesi]CAA9989308.1 SAC3 domain-containing protein, putative [Plasmodium knowlesi strain H]SBO26117.1 SAC3/GNAP family-related protein, putative [Plasmodium knowlesi strain H]SBO26778.1 SAC3/GNAP family-related protein, putative [Plasmodium knowlesi strain H]VVS78782.1 SAC3 domain-containing protein, putative [Plasmodium knowlesi strain H]|eukprot:XP_002261655.1 SAC3/GNAP family-related protein, putative [Plasmodium knowlesi strain H]
MSGVNRRGSKEEGGKNGGAAFNTSGESSSMYQTSSKEGNNKFLYNNGNYGGYGTPGSGLSTLQNFSTLNSPPNVYQNSYQNTYPGGGYQNMTYQMGGYQGGGNPSGSYGNYESGNYLYSKNKNYYSNFNNYGDNSSYNNAKDCSNIGVGVGKRTNNISSAKEVHEEEAKKNEDNNDPVCNNVNKDDKYVEMYINKVKEIYYFHVFYHYLKLGYPEKEASMESKKYIFITLSRYFLLVKNAILSSAESIKQINNCVCSNLSYYQQQTNLQEFLLNQQVNLQGMNLGSLNIGNINLPLSDHEKLEDLSKVNSGEVGSAEQHPMGGAAKGSSSTDIQGGGNPSNVYNFKAEKINNMIDSIEEMKKLNKNKKMNIYNYDEQTSGTCGENDNGIMNSNNNGKEYSFNNNEEAKKKISFTLNKSKNKLFQMYNRVGNDPSRRIATNDEVDQASRHLGDEGRNNKRNMQSSIYPANAVTMQDTSNITRNNFVNMFMYDQERLRNEGSGPMISDVKSGNGITEGVQMKPGPSGYANRGVENNAHVGFNHNQVGTYSGGDEAKGSKTDCFLNNQGVKVNDESVLNNKYKRNSTSGFNRMSGMSHDRDINGNDKKLYGNVSYSSYGRDGDSSPFPNGMNMKGNYEASNNLLGRMGHRASDDKEQFVQGSKQRYDGKRTIGDEGNDMEEREQMLQHGKDNRFGKDVNDTGRSVNQMIRKQVSGRYRMQKDGIREGEDLDRGNGGIYNDGDYDGDNLGSGIYTSGSRKYPEIPRAHKTTGEEESLDEVKKCDTFKMYINNIQEEFKEECKNIEFSKMLREFTSRLMTWNRKRGANTRFWRFNVMPTKEDILSMDILFFTRRKSKKRYAQNDEDNDMEYGINFGDKKKKLSAEEIESRDRRLEKYGDLSKGRKNEQWDNSFHIDYNGSYEMNHTDYNTLERLLDKYNFSSCYKNKNFVGLCKNIQKFFFRLTSLPERKNVRSFSVLKCTYAYVLHKYNQDRNYKYINEQFRSMRQDMNIQNIFHDDVINIYETNIRICIVNNDLFQFLQCINKLFELYQRLNIKKSKVEFLCYKLIYLTLQNMHQEFLVEYLTLTDEEKNHENVQLCYYLNECIKNKMYLVNINMVSPLDDEVNHLYIYRRVFINEHILTYLPNLMSLNENKDLNVNMDLLVQFVKDHSEIKNYDVPECVEGGGVKKNVVKMPYLTNYLIVLFLPKYRLLALINICMTSIKVGLSTLTRLLNFENDETCLSFLQEVNTIMKNNEVISKPSLDNLMKSPLLKNKYINHIR